MTVLSGKSTYKTLINQGFQRRGDFAMFKVAPFLQKIVRKRG